MGAMSIGHWLIVLVVVLLLFGPKRLGDVGKGLGQGLKGLRDGLAGKEQEGNPNGTPPGNDARPEKADTK